jgi:GMP synthase (glutamine-hydrolysing)
MKTLQVWRHIAFEGLGHFEPVFREAGYVIDILDPGAVDASTLSAADADLLVVLGGPIGAYEENRYPFLHTELRALEQRLAAGRPTLGICLGAQLLARAAGARVYPSGHREIGLAPIRLTKAGAQGALAAYADAPLAFHWHGDTFDLPAGAERLASTALCTNQAFALGSAVGFQFHPEADLAGIESWLVGHACELAQAGIDIPALRTQALAATEEQRRKARAVAQALVAGWDGPSNR